MNSLLYWDDFEPNKNVRENLEAMRDLINSTLRDI